MIDPDGYLKAAEIHDLGIGRSGCELLRKVQAAKFVREHGGEVCPAKRPARTPSSQASNWWVRSEPNSLAPAGPNYYIAL